MCGLGTFGPPAKRTTDESENEKEPDGQGKRDGERMAESRRRVQVVESNGAWGVFFLLAYVGAAIYFISHSDGSFWAVVLGLLQAMVWPAYVIYHGLALLGA